MPTCFYCGVFVKQTHSCLLRCRECKEVLCGSKHHLYHLENDHGQSLVPQDLPDHPFCCICLYRITEDPPIRDSTRPGEIYHTRCHLKRR